MILECSLCNARYAVPDQSLGSKGRMVRCAKCSHTWFQQPSVEATEKILGELDKVLEDINARPKPMARGSNVPAIPGSYVSMRFRLTVAASLLIGVASGLLMFKPAWLGLPPSTPFTLADVGITRLTVNQQPAYGLSGKVQNTGTVSLPAPIVRITLVDDKGNAMQSSDYISPEKTIEGGKTFSFSTENITVAANSKATRFVVELGNRFELSLRRKPE